MDVLKVPNEGNRVFHLIHLYRFGCCNGLRGIGRLLGTYAG